MLHLKVAGTGSYLPEEVIPNEFFVGREWNRYDENGDIIGTKFIEDPEEDIVKVTGIEESPLPMNFLLIWELKQHDKQ